MPSSSPLCSPRKREKRVWFIRNRVLRVQPDLTDENQKINLKDLPGHGIDRSRWRDRSIEVGSSFCNRLTWAWSISIWSAYFRCSGYIYQDRPVQIERLLTWSIDSFEKKTSNFKFFWGDFYIFLIILIKNYILIFNNCFINRNFEFLIGINGSIAVLKIFRLIEHKVYEISLIGHNYHILGLKNNFLYNLTVWEFFCFFF